MNRRREWLVLALVVCVGLLLEAAWMREWGPQVRPTLDVRPPGATLDEAGWHLRVERIVQSDHLTGLLGSEPQVGQAPAGFSFVLVELEASSEPDSDACQPKLRMVDGVLLSPSINVLVPLVRCDFPEPRRVWALYEVPVGHVDEVVGLDLEPEDAGRHVVLRPAR